MLEGNADDMVKLTNDSRMSGDDASLGEGRGRLGTRRNYSYEAEQGQCRQTYEYYISGLPPLLTW